MGEDINLASEILTAFFYKNKGKKIDGGFIDKRAAGTLRKETGESFRWEGRRRETYHNSATEGGANRV